MDLEKQGWQVSSIRLLETGGFEVDVLDEQGDLYNLPFELPVADDPR